jgi:hypothetical protein
MADSALLKKLGIKAGMKLLVLNAPDGYTKTLGTEVATSASGTSDFVQLFAYQRADIDRLRQTAIKAVKDGGLLWVTYPKKTSGMKSDLFREAVWEAMNGTGWRPVSQIAIDDTWSALRFRPEADVKPGKKS